MGIFPLNIYLRVRGYPTNYPMRYPGNKLPGYGSLILSLMLAQCTGSRPTRPVNTGAILYSRVYRLCWRAVNMG